MQQTIDLEPGLAVVKYVPSEGDTYNAVIGINVAPESEDALELLFDPTVRNGQLRRPGQCVAIACLRRARIHLSVSTDKSHGSPRGSVKIEYLSRTPHNQSVPKADAQIESFRVEGHLANRGDKVVRNGEWLAGPDNPCRIEGLVLHWPTCPPGLMIEYSRPSGKHSMELGEFLGTKGRHQSLAGVEIALKGEGAETVSLSGEAWFHIQGRVPAEGQRVSFISNHANDVLMGLKLELRQKLRSLDAQTARSSLQSFTSSKKPRIRIFKG